MQYFCMKLFQYNECLVNTMDTDALVLKHQGINGYSAKNTSLRF